MTSRKKQVRRYRVLLKHPSGATVDDLQHAYDALDAANQSRVTWAGNGYVVVSVSPAPRVESE